jgi:hypothetical protein
MKKVIKQIGIIAITAIIVFSIAACSGGGGGGGNPKSLAQQSAKFYQEVEAGKYSDEEEEKQAQAFGAKIEKLSEADRKIYYEEFDKLMNK